MLKVWQKADPRTFCLAKALEYRNEIVTIIRQAQTGKAKEALERILVDKWDCDNENFINVMKVIFPKSIENDLYWVFYKLRWQILNELKALTLRNCKEKKLLGDFNIQRSELLQEVKKLAENEKKPVGESVKEFCEKKGIKDVEVVKAVESTFTKDRGTKLESKAVEVFGKENNMEFTEVDIDILQSKLMECDGITWTLQGRADALTEDTVVEVKNRKNRFMVPLPQYDLLQLQAYLFLYDREIGILLERMNEENKETAVEFDVEQWVNEIIPGMKSFVEELKNIIIKTKERFDEPSPPCLVDESIKNNTSPSKRSSEDGDTTVQDKKPRTDLEMDIVSAKLVMAEDIPRHPENASEKSLVQDMTPCPNVSDVTISEQKAHEEPVEDLNNLEELFEDSDDTWWNKYV